MGYTPRFSYFAVSVVLGFALLWISVYMSEHVAKILIFGGGVFIFASFVFLWTHVMATYDNHWTTLESFAHTYGKLDDESRAALGFKFPTLRYKMKRGEVKEMFEDTNATADQFRLFLQTSNDKYISPKRDWQTAERPAAIWQDIKEWLEAEGYIQPDSAAGSYSWLWIGNSYRHLMAYWMSGRHLQNMGGQVSYASDEEMVYER